MGSFFSEHWGDLASVAGFVVSGLGVWVAAWQAWKARNAAEGARRAAQSARDTMAHVDAVSQLTAIVAKIEEVKTLIRGNLWHPIPDRLATARTQCGQVAAAIRQTTDAERRDLTATLAQLRYIEEDIDRSLAQQQPPANGLEMIVVLNKQADRLHQILATVRRKSEGMPHV
jgi:hypothetical protein